MSRIKDPSEKKRASLERDHRTFALEGSKSFRTAWPQKKARANRQHRHAAATALDKEALAAGEDVPESLAAQPKRTLKKWGVTSLAQSITVKDGQGLRWSHALTKNPDALQLQLRRAARNRRT